MANLYENHSQTCGVTAHGAPVRFPMAIPARIIWAGDCHYLHFHHKIFHDEI